jgi:magnesium-transporting ATPase (P-type)
MEPHSGCHFQTAEQVLQFFEVDKSIGLTDALSAERALKYGKNALQGKSQNTLLRVFVSNVINPMNAILGLAFIVSIVINDLVFYY